MRTLYEQRSCSEFPIVEDPQLARGFDYYTRTVFEGYVGEFNLAVVGGGRYDHLVSFYGGPDVPGIGFAIGLERLITSLEEVPIIDPSRRKLTFWPHWRRHD